MKILCSSAGSAEASGRLTDFHVFCCPRRSFALEHLVRHIKAFDPAVLEAMQGLQATVDVLEKSPAVVREMNQGQVVNY